VKIAQNEKIISILPYGVLNVIDKDLKGQIGDSYSVVIRNVVIAYLTAKGYLLVNNIYLSNVEQIPIELSIHNTLITATSEILEKKCRPNHKGCEKMPKENYHGDIH